MACGSINNDGATDYVRYTATNGITTKVYLLADKIIGLTNKEWAIEEIKSQPFF